MTRRLILVGVVVAALLGYGGYRLWSSRQPFEWTGTVEARNAEIGSRVGGRVAQVLVVEGDEVEPGQALIVLEPGDLLAQAQQMAQLFLLPSIFLSGYIFPVQGLPAPLYWLGRLLPATHMIEVLRGVILRDAGVMELLPHIGALCAISAAFVALGVSSFQRTAR